MGTVLNFTPTDDEIAEAWAAFDAANLESIRVSEDPACTPHDWFRATVAEVNLYRRFYSVCVRAGIVG